MTNLDFNNFAATLDDLKIHSILATSTCISDMLCKSLARISAIVMAIISALILASNLGINYSDNLNINYSSNLGSILAKSTAEIMAIFLTIISARFLLHEIRSTYKILLI